MSTLRIRVRGKARDLMLKLAEERQLFTWFGDDFAVEGTPLNTTLFLNDIKRRFSAETYDRVTGSMTMGRNPINGRRRITFHGAQMLGDTFTIKL